MQTKEPKKMEWACQHNGASPVLIHCMVLELKPFFLTPPGNASCLVVEEIIYPIAGGSHPLPFIPSALVVMVADNCSRARG